MQDVATYDPATTTDAEEAAFEERFLSDMLTERWYQQEMLPEVRKDVREFAAKYGGYKRHLLAKIFHDLREFFWWGCLLERIDWETELRREHQASGHIGGIPTSEWRPYFIRAFVENIAEKMERLDHQIRFTKDRLDGKPMPKGQVTEEMKARARAYPIKEILAQRGEHPVANGKYLCIYHKEKTPSMSIYKNRLHCFGCGKEDDGIGVLRHLTGKSFPAAVRQLCGGA